TSTTIRSSEGPRRERHLRRPLGAPRRTVVRLRVLAAAVVALWAAAAGADEQMLLVTVGEVGDRGAVVWIRGVSASPVSITYARAGGGEERQVQAALSVAADRTGKASLS